MKRKKIVPLAAAMICVAISASCKSEPELVAPNPGFGIISMGKDRRNLFTPLVGARTTGEIARVPFTNQPLIPGGATGREHRFDVTSNSQAKAIAPDRVAPAFWRFTCVSGWNFLDIPPNYPIMPAQPASCDGKSNNFTPQPGQFSLLVCLPIFGAFGEISPSNIDVSGSAVEVQVPAQGVTTTYGMPTLQFYDVDGTYVAQTTATSIDTDYGLWAKGWTGCLAGMPAGTYNVQVVNTTADGAGEVAGSGHMYIYGASSANYIDDNQYFVAQQYRDFLNRAPDQGGLDFWTGTITQCSSVSYRQSGETYAQCVARKRVDVALAFWASQEFRQLHPAVVNPSGSPAYNNDEFVRLCHVLYLQRDPTQADKDFSMGNLIGTNNDYGFVIKGFINSDEYRNRFEPPPPPVCNPTWEETNSCQQQGGWWDYAGCWCNYGGPMY